MHSITISQECSMRTCERTARIHRSCFARVDLVQNIKAYLELNGYEWHDRSLDDVARPVLAYDDDPQIVIMCAGCVYQRKEMMTLCKMKDMHIIGYTDIDDAFDMPHIPDHTSIVYKYR